MDQAKTQKKKKTKKQKQKLINKKKSTKRIKMCNMKLVIWN